MKKGLALLLSLLMLLRVSVVYGAQEDGLAEAITRVKSMVTVPDATAPESGWYDAGTAFIELPVGTYDCTVVVKSYSPFELLSGA